MRIKLMNDYTVELPLWGDEGLLDDDVSLISEDLERQLRAWASNFNEHFSWETGWPSAEMESAHRVEGERLFVELQAALPRDDVTFQYWEKGHQ